MECWWIYWVKIDFVDWVRNIPVGKITARQAVMLNKAAEELPSESDITGADDIELQEIAEKHQT